MGIRDDFYKGLRAEYAQDPDSSFLFRFLKNEHRTDCDQMSVDDLLGRLANRNLTLNLPEAGREWLCARRARGWRTAAGGAGAHAGGAEAIPAHSGGIEETAGGCA